jgi:S-adenosylmethionine:tRNA-ribosyltransferase-isomerase (queuine synthetase)
MAYSARNLSVLSYANGFTLWHYTTPDATGTVTGSNYFNDAADLLRKGDLILANTSTGGSIAAKIYGVTASSGGTVTIAAYS